MAKKEIEPATYEDWNSRFNEALASIEGKEQKLENVYSEVELDLILVGSTAIEDRLQEDVKETIEAFKETGIKVWVLTGDKVETAINIGYSCGLLNSQMTQYVITATDTGVLKEELMRIEQESQATGKEGSIALIIAGGAFSRVEIDSDLRGRFLSITDHVDVVIACRVSPVQKGDIVEMIRERFPNKMTLAIGDGANDVAMIKKAHVGVGIAGREGQQAARPSDYAIGKFKHLRPLLFVHGREAYRRVAYLVCYNFYKNFLYVVVQYLFGFYSVFSGQTLYEPWVYQLYNISFTGAALFYWGVFDLQYDKKRLVDEPQLYRVGMEGRLFSTKVFWSW